MTDGLNKFAERIEPLSAKPLVADERRRLFSLFEDEILDNFDPADYRELLEYILWLETKQ